jgi:uncharacterized damage-inducible protein DinB
LYEERELGARPSASGLRRFFRPALAVAVALLRMVAELVPRPAGKVSPAARAASSAGGTMNAKDVLKHALRMNHDIINGYLGDLSDADLLVRPVPGANHIAWQLGHVINAEAQYFLPQIPGATVPELPADFGKQHDKERSKSDTGFRTKDEYLNLFNKVRQATLAALDKIPEADLDKPVTGNLARIAPTLGAVFFLAANHEMMHAGQFTVVRRKLGKPVLF